MAEGQTESQIAFPVRAALPASGLVQIDKFHAFQNGIPASPSGYADAGEHVLHPDPRLCPHGHVTAHRRKYGKRAEHPARAGGKLLQQIAFILVLAGGIGNLIDRVLNGEVVDYINPLFIDFAVFNFADILVCVGVALWVLVILLEEVEDKPSKEQ